MELLLLGTAAAEGWPAPVCDCDGCQAARQLGGPNIRSRSGALIDDDLKIDFSPDTVSQLQRLGRSLTSVRTILFTHEHSDHLAAPELQWFVPPFTLTPPKHTLHIYGNVQVIDEIHRCVRKELRDASELHVMRELEKITTADGDTVLPLPAEHAPGSLLLRITRSAARGGKTILYGHDSGTFPPATLDALSDGVKLDIALFDCTYGIDEHPRAHMGVNGVTRLADELRRRGAITDRTRCIATHFSHGGKALHEELLRLLAPYRIEAAYDGMMVKV
jgi:phosphoribosyl 1,2-cyclic phosphate phosphodiesterase